MEPHSWYKPKRYPYLVCKHCGLVKLNNKLTEWAVRKGCTFSEHPEYKEAIVRYTKFQ